MAFRSNRRALGFASGLLALGLVFGACGDDGGGDDGGQETDAAQSPAEEEDSSAAGSTVAVTAEEYKFDVESSLPAGPTTIEFTNAGKKPHELLLFSFNGDETLDDVLKLPEKEAMKVVTVVGGTFAKPGEDAKEPLEADLAPGRYAMICTVSDGKGKPPHFVMGMANEITVE